MVCTNYMLNGFLFLSEFSANIISIVMSIQNILLINIGINDLNLDSYHKTIVSENSPTLSHASNAILLTSGVSRS